LQCCARADVGTSSVRFVTVNETVDASMQFQ
jgi:hypothetical protein